jgi:hypothetical protein
MVETDFLVNYHEIDKDKQARQVSSWAEITMTNETGERKSRPITSQACTAEKRNWQ